MKYQIAIDGPSGAGKSTVAKLIAKKLGCVYIDTGAMYRAMGLFFDRNNEMPDIKTLCEKADITISYDQQGQRIYLNKEDVTEQIRTQSAAMSASRVSAYPIVREKLVELQRKLAEGSNVVMDGRDIGTVVLPDATLKIFLTADILTRAKRRKEQLLRKGVNEDIAKIKEDLKKRDHDDRCRKTSPLRQADDAVLLDNSAQSLDESADTVILMLKERIK